MRGGGSRWTVDSGPRIDDSRLWTVDEGRINLGFFLLTWGAEFCILRLLRVQIGVFAIVLSAVECTKRHIAAGRQTRKLVNKQPASLFLCAFLEENRRRCRGLNVFERCERLLLLG
jgi:hypothetical protein